MIQFHTQKMSLRGSLFGARLVYLVRMYIASVVFLIEITKCLYGQVSSPVRNTSGERGGILLIEIKNFKYKHSEIHSEDIIDSFLNIVMQ